MRSTTIVVGDKEDEILPADKDASVVGHLLVLSLDGRRVEFDATSVGH